MILSTFIVEDSQKDYKRMVKLLECYDFIHLDSKYFNETPYDEALKHIQDKILKPDLYIIDYDLNQGSQKTGLEFFWEVNNPNSFCIFYSRLPEAVDAQAYFTNSRFIRKTIDPIVSIEQLEEALKRVKEYFCERSAVKLKYTIVNKMACMDPATDNFLCKNLIQVRGDQKNYVFYVWDSGSIVEYIGSASDGIGIILDKILLEPFPYFEICKDRPKTLINIIFYEAITGGYRLKLKYGTDSRLTVWK